MDPPRRLAQLFGGNYVLLLVLVVRKWTFPVSGPLHELCTGGPLSVARLYVLQRMMLPDATYITTADSLSLEVMSLLEVEEYHTTYRRKYYYYYLLRIHTNN